MNWIRDFHWDLGKASISLPDKKAVLCWEANDPWILTVDGQKKENLPFIKAEDWGLAIKYAEKILNEEL